VTQQAQSVFTRVVVRQALVGSLAKLDPRVQMRNPVMFVVELGALITTGGWLIQVFGGAPLGGVWIQKAIGGLSREMKPAGSNEL
jgi:K+-transporting ATPase ATPase B chain